MGKAVASLFDEQFKLERISELGDPLEKLEKCVKWNIFRPILNKVFSQEAKGPGGRPAFDYVMMFKILILQEYFGLSDEQAEYQITDRFSFLRFLGLRTCSKVPDQNTIWHFRERLKEKDAVKDLFKCFHEELKQKGYILGKGKIVDASIVEAPRQRNSREENKQIKNGEVPQDWSAKKRSHKDTDATWTKKGKANYYGYKNHIKIDRKKKFIDVYEVSSACVHDAGPGKDLLSKKDKGQTIHADSAYVKSFAEEAKKYGMIPVINEQGCRQRPLTEKQKKRNRKKSKVRCRIEHVFGFLHQARGKVMVKTIGMARAKIKIGLMNLCYNLFRYRFYVKL